MISRLLVTRQFRHYLEHTNWLAAATIAVALAGGASRGLALYYNYGAPMNTWMHVSHLPFSEPDRYEPFCTAVGGGGRQKADE